MRPTCPICHACPIITCVRLCVDFSGLQLAVSRPSTRTCEHYVRRGHSLQSDRGSRLVPALAIFQGQPARVCVQRVQDPKQALAHARVATSRMVTAAGVGGARDPHNSRRCGSSGSRREWRHRCRRITHGTATCIAAGTAAAGGAAHWGYQPCGAAGAPHGQAGGRERGSSRARCCPATGPSWCSAQYPLLAH